MIAQSARPPLDEAAIHHFRRRVLGRQSIGIRDIDELAAVLVASGKEIR
jgi:hypothetical protein